jgi:hypothetical protein
VNWAGWGVFIERRAKDASGMGNDGTKEGGVTDNAGKIYRALGFNGTNAYISVENNASLNPTRVTVEAWAFFVEQPASGTQQAIVSKFAGISWNSKGYQIHIETTSGGVFQVAFGVGPGAYEYGSWATYQTSFVSGWHHLVGTFDGSTLRLYYDGSQVATASWTGNIGASDDSLCIGRKADASSAFFRGIIDEVRIENQAISSTEVSYRYNSGNGRYLGPNENTVLLFHFDTPININLSGATALKFWIKTPRNLKVEIEAPKGNTQTKYISDYGWDGTENWQEITIPASAWQNLSQVHCPFKVTIEDNKTFYVDFVRWEGTVPPPQIAVLDSRGALDFAWSRHLYVIMGFWVDRSVDLTKSWVRENLKSGFVQLVSRWKDHPAVLMWAFGNEADVYAGRKENWFSLVQEAAQAAKQVDNNHPIMTVNQDITRIGNENIGSHDDNLTALDVWGVNVYHGSSFGSLFDNYRNMSSKPLFLAEWGCDALDARDNTENEVMQAEYLDNLWKEISENLSAENENRVCIGGTVFEWCDEWWKAGRWESHDNLATWTSPYYYDYVSGANNMNEEWWGVMKFTSLENPVKTPRQAYYTLKNRWTQ